MRIWRDCVLGSDLEDSLTNDSLSLLRFKYAIQEATRFDAVFDWDVKAFANAFDEFRRDWPGTETREAQSSPIDRLTVKPRKAYETYLAAEEALGSGVTDDQAYDWVKNELDDPSVLPEREAWKRNLGKARQLLGTQKRKRRTVPESKSIVNRRDLD